MNKFKVGDKVVRLPRADNSLFAYVQGDKDYYVVTSISNGRSFVQLDGVAYQADPHPWDYKNFELYQEPGDDELPPAPVSVQYYNSTTDEDNFQHMLVQPHWELEGHLSIAIVKSGKKFDPTAYGDVLSLNLDPESALQLASDLRRMAMDIKRKEKAQ